LKITPETIRGFSDTILSSRYDNPQPTPDFHDELWEYCCSDKRKVAIAAPRGHAKSTAVTLAYALASLLWRDKTFILIISDTEDQAASFLQNIASELIDNEALRTIPEQEAKEILKERYGNKKGQPMFIDDKSGKPHKIGKIFGFKNADISHPYTDEGKKNEWYQEDWVELKKVKKQELIGT